MTLLQKYRKERQENIANLFTSVEEHTRKAAQMHSLRGEWPSGLYSLRQVTEVKLGRVRSDFGWVTSED